MIARIIHISFYYLSLIPLTSFLLFRFLPPGQVDLARILMAVILVLLILPLWILLRGIPKSSFHLPKNCIWFCVAFVLGLAFLIWRISIHTQGMTDAWQMWNMKGKFYFVSFATGQDFRLVLSEWFHPGYPIFFPLQLAGLAILFGSWNPVIPVLVAVAYYLLIALIFLELSQKIHSASPYWPRTLSDFGFLLAIALPALPGIIMATAEQCADIPLAAFLLYAFRLTVSPLDWQSQSRADSSRMLVLLGLSCGAILHINNEGVLLMMFVLPVFAWVHRSRLKLPRGAVAFLGPLFMSVLLLVLFKANAPELQPYKFQSERVIHDVLDLSRYAFIIKGFLAFQILTAFFAPFVAVFLVWQYRRGDFFLFLPLLLNFAFYHAFFLITPDDLPWHWISAYHRINIQIMPAWFFLAAASLGGGIALQNVQNE
ncbi:MAG: hypothetical protein K8S54_13905 [Spirochaetia bacterium]|nr:hypothetical protein [Spirochaetia bacterium]